MRSRQLTPVPPLNRSATAETPEVGHESPVAVTSTGLAAAALMTWPFMCPLCCAGELAEPVELHAPEAPATTPASGFRHCLACRACAEHFFAAARVVPNGLSGGSHGGDAGEGCDGAGQCLACPLCAASLAVDAASSTPATRPVLTSLLETLVVRNAYTGTQPPTPSSTASTSAPPSAPACRCAVCEESVATSVCLQCDFGLCDACRRATHTRGGFKQHEVVTLEQARRRDHRKCSTHAGMALDLFCETCASCVCVTCCFGGAHRGHEVFPLAEVAARRAAALAERSTELESLERAAEAARVQLTSLAPAYEATVRGVRDDIQRCFADLRTLLQQREEDLLTQLHNAASAVAERAALLTTAVSAAGALVRDTSARLREMPSRVSAATLLRIAAVVAQQQEWVARTSTLVVDAATAAADSWTYQMGSDGANGCRMATFVLLNAETPNAEGLRQYRRVLADLGRLDLVTDLHMPLAGRPSTASQSSVDSGNNNGDVLEAEDAAPDWDDTPADSAGHDPTSAMAQGTATGACSPATDLVEEEMILVRHSHVDSTAPPSPTRCAPHLCGTSATSQAAPSASPRLAECERLSPPLGGVSRSNSLRGTSRACEPHAGLGIVETASLSVAATPGTGYWGPGTVASRWRAAHDESGGLGVGRGLMAARLARDTMPFRVSLPPRRAGSEDGDYCEALLPWRAPKLRHGSSAQESRAEYPTASLPRRASVTRLAHPTAELDLRKPGASAGAGLGVPGVAAGRLTRAGSQRRTTGLHLEL